MPERWRILAAARQDRLCIRAGSRPSAVIHEWRRCARENTCAAAIADSSALPLETRAIETITKNRVVVASHGGCSETGD